MDMPLAPRRRQENDPATAYHGLGVGTQRTHAVQFYEDDQFLIASVGDFLASGLAIGQRVLAVATAMHGASLRAHLERRGFDVERAMLRGQLTIADADEVLATFMADALPERRRFRTAMARLFRTMDARTGHRSVRVFGEMVDVLCRKGNVTGAIRLEELWNELAGKECFSLLCAYSMSSFSDEDHAKSVAMICGEHAHVIPTEHYMQVESDARLREVAMLQ